MAVCTASLQNSRGFSTIMMRNKNKKVNTMLRFIDQKNNAKLFFNECLKRRRTVKFESFKISLDLNARPNGSENNF